MAHFEQNELGTYRKQAIKAAKDFHYGDKVIADLKAAKSETEIYRIMHNARKEHFK